MYFSGLPPDILLEVIELMDVPTLLNLRLVSRSTRQLIDAYEASLSAAVTQNYQWIVNFDYDAPDIRTSSIKQLHQFARLDLIREVASHEQARPMTSMCTNTYPLALGEELTRRLTHGIAIYRRFLEITKAAQETEIQQRKSVPLGWLSLSLNTPVVVEFSHRDYVKGLSSADIFNYVLLYYFVERFSFPALPCLVRHKGSKASAPTYINAPDDDSVASPSTSAIRKKRPTSPIGRLATLPNKIAQFLSTPLHIDHYKSQIPSRKRPQPYSQSPAPEQATGALPKQRGCKASGCSIKGPLLMYNKIRVLRADELRRPKEFLQETIAFTRKLLAMTERDATAS